MKQKKGKIMFENMTLTQYNEILASKSPTPGGGSALAVVGTVACSLVEMSVNVTLNKGASEEVCEILQSNASFFAKARKCLFKLSDDDAQAFRHIVDCMHLPKETAEQAAFRTAELQKAYHKAALVPLDVMRICFEAKKRAQDKVFAHLYKYVASDCKIGIDLFANIIENSMENVFANTSLIADATLRQTLEKQGQEIVAELKR
ncbi:MAG: cyclodeaminase/cyclohydrolase family protein [Candidatus Fimimonas sp.]